MNALRRAPIFGKQKIELMEDKLFTRRFVGFIVAAVFYSTLSNGASRLDGFSVGLLEAGTGRILTGKEDDKEFKGKALTGAVLELAADRPGVVFEITARQIVMKTPTGKKISAIYYFLAGEESEKFSAYLMKNSMMSGNVVTIGDRSFDAFGSLARMGMRIGKGGGIQFESLKAGKLQLGFVFPGIYSPENRIVFLGKEAVPLKKKCNAPH
ncbi:MAG: hypothetical protein IPP68_03890 [Elusimicrobia bacterium]|nr:hypothetical protein [Elusimicrobiota bacterium]